MSAQSFEAWRRQVYVAHGRMLTAGLLLLGFGVPLRGWALWAAAMVLLVASVVAVGRAARGRREHRA